jgi:Ser/Thr protein kinase RdoA (MazF antagonist)
MSFVDTAVAAASDAARRAGLGDQRPELIRLGERGVLRMDGGRVIARVARGLDRMEEARREVAVARWLFSQGVGVNEPLAGDQPMVAAGTVVSLWHAVDGEWTRPADLAALLRCLHALTPPDGLSLPELDPFSRVDERIAAAREITEAERDRLHSVADHLRGELARLVYVLPRSMIHGDANIGNVLKTTTGDLVLFDLDGVCWGPPEWDLAITAVYRDLGWHSDEEYAEFCEIYGFDVTDLPGYQALRAVRELRMTCWLSQKAADEEKIAAEVRQRIADLVDPDAPRRWHPY